ncbi:MAG TPA: DUF4259 domain-containing protein [Bacteroidia bacterium]|nr:DUF4259 domain-containing protein [Bacteroidia bacterium]
MVGISNFESDSAGAFISDLFTTGYGLLEVALDRVLDEDEPASLTDCEEALVAAEFIAGLSGNPAYDFPEDGRDWLREELPPGSESFDLVIGLKDKAADVIDRIVSDSELREMWEGNVNYDEWFNNLVDLQNRLSDPAED